MDGLRGVAARLLVELAVVLERTVAGEVANERLKRRRNAALRAAHTRGVPVETLAARLGLSEAWVRRVVNGGPPAARTMDP
ncbi:MULTISPECIES: helix-turn-helix domain-containing protein [unclassified Streptomyces]|uniref:helix-turn-helix domain-containing protein n=1 Tax=unclassified Streptomyces TaxID=2593676 RepID=UPI00093FD4B8|nr:helix-turn-helix domain-containing protein [Streptomyces sp. TSRI0107]OKJ77189.1 hypothetical protein AMK31_27460 [Streptomyces sp. TSRI0107]